MTAAPNYRVSIGVASYTIGYLGADRDYHMAAVSGPGNLGRLPADLRPDYQDYGYSSRRSAAAAVAWLEANR